MPGTELFVYGTLRHDQREHRLYCRGVVGWQPARVRGRLYSIPSGYRLLLVPQHSVLMHATLDPATDEAHRKTIGPTDLLAAADGTESEPWTWIEGELLSFSDAQIAWPPLDGWENFVPGKPGIYPRCVIPVHLVTALKNPPIAAWAYVATDVPPGSIAL